MGPAQHAPSALDALLARSDIRRGGAVGATVQPGVPGPLDAILPGRGWPAGCLTEPPPIACWHRRVAGCGSALATLARAASRSRCLPACCTPRRARRRGRRLRARAGGARTPRSRCGPPSRLMASRACGARVAGHDQVPRAAPAAARCRERPRLRLPVAPARGGGCVVARRAAPAPGRLRRRPRRPLLKRRGPALARPVLSMPSPYPGVKVPMLWIAIHLPHLPVELLTRGASPPEPLAVVDGRRFGLLGRIARPRIERRAQRERGRRRQAGLHAACGGASIAVDDAPAVDDGERLRRRRAAGEQFDREVREMDRDPEHRDFHAGVRRRHREGRAARARARGA